MTIKLQKLLVLIIITTVMYSCNKQLPSQANLEINEKWSFRDVGNSNWLSATVPGCVHTDLMDNSIIDDPYYRLNEHDVQWIDKKNWEYRTSFKVSDQMLKYDVVELHFDGLDTYTDIYLNGSLILKTDNMFRSYCVDCKEILKEGTNSLRVLIHSPTTIGLQKYNELDYIIPVSGTDLSEVGGLGDKKVGVFTRKAPYHFGWDWGPRLVTSGIWKPITLSFWNKARIRDVFVQDSIITADIAVLKANIEIEATQVLQGELIIKVDSDIISRKKIILPINISNTIVTFEIDNPNLWWPNGLGEANLYNITVELVENQSVIDTKPVVKGLRNVEVVQKKDSVGQSFGFNINGIPVFAKGVNYIPQDVFLNRVSAADYTGIIKAAVDANMNMIRVWGGGIYENDLFYQLCDEYGIMVWQDFMFACSMYPGDSSFLNNVREEAAENVKRLRNHSSVVLWCGNNEILSAWKNWGYEKRVVKDYGHEVAAKIWRTYEDIFYNILPEAVKKYDPDKFYWASSPSAEQSVTKNWTSGDNHYWGVWWGKEPFENYEKRIPRFMSEFGFQSFPDINSVKKYSLPADWNIDSEVMKSHQRSSIGNVTIEEYLLRDYNEPKDFGMFLYVGQLLQARGISMGIETHRRNMPYCMGSLYWQINDCWPVASWSSIDYYGNWKALHYAVADAFKNVKISFEANNNDLDVYVISDSLINFEANLKLSVIDFQGTILYESEENIIIEGNSSRVYLEEDITAITVGHSKNELLINAVLTDINGKIIDRSVYYFVSPKNLVLPSPNVSLEIKRIDDNKFVVKLTTDVLAKNVYLLSPVEGHFSENYFDLLPNEKKELLFITDEEIIAGNLNKEITILTLIDSYDL